MTSKLPSVTEICCLHIDRHWFPPGCAERGSKVHSWANHFLNNIWDPFVEEEYPNYVTGLKKWFENNEAKIIFGEGNLINKESGFRGHPDFVGTIKDEDGFGLIDFKTSNSVQPWWKLQLAAYASLAECNKEEIGIDKLSWVASLSVNKEGEVTFNKYDKKEIDKEPLKKFMNMLYFYTRWYTLSNKEDNEFTKSMSLLSKKFGLSTQQLLANYVRYNAVHHKSHFNKVKGA